MPANLPVPGTARLEELLKQCFAAMPEADPARLDRLEERLVRRLPAAPAKKRQPGVPWWIILLLAGGVASAAWFAGEIWQEKTAAPALQTGPETDTGGERETVEPRQGPAQSPPAESDDSPVIYQREGF